MAALGGPLTSKIVFEAGFQRAFEHLVPGGCGVNRRGLIQQLFASRRFDIRPQLIRSPQERYVRCVLVVGEADYSIHPVGRSFGVRDVEFFQSEYFLTSFRQVMNSRAAHSANADHDAVKFLNHRLISHVQCVQIHTQSCHRRT